MTIGPFEVAPGRRLQLLCIGAHSDDIEIGCAGTVLEWLKGHPGSSVTWVVLSTEDTREVEARKSATALLKGASDSQLVLGKFPDGRFPSQFDELKDLFEVLKRQVRPDVILTHRLEDRHQDHRLTAELTWQTWRREAILEYEIPKYEGDLGAPNVYVPLRAATASRKITHLMRHFGTQRSRSWFSRKTFAATMRLRGVECRAMSGYAEAFTARKLVL
jgi:LmbE family N-acetylglucosaminyl deacetylase